MSSVKAINPSKTLIKKVLTNDKQVSLIFKKNVEKKCSLINAMEVLKPNYNSSDRYYLSVSR